jgi:PadR family transcriptional regulator, regulatory protein AphA
LSSGTLTPTSYVVLALVGEGGASAHDLVRMMGQGGPVYWGAAESKLYAEPKRLARSGYLNSRREPGRTNPRTVYTLTAAGRRALRDWLATPARFPTIKNEAHLRLLAGDMLDDHAIVESLRGMLPELDRLDALVQEMDAQAHRVPQRARYLKLNHAYARKLIALHREWISAIENELADPPNR